MYARARFTVEQHDNALVVPTLAVVDLQGKIGVWLPGDEGDKPVFNPVTIGIEQQEFTEVTNGVKEGQRIISTGAAALRPAIGSCWPGQRGGGPRRAAAVAAGAAAAPRAGVNANQAQQPARQMLGGSRRRRYAVRRSTITVDDCGADDEHPANSDRTARDDVHDQRDHHPAGRYLSHPPAGRPAARRDISDGQRPVRYPGVGPQEIEQIITRPIEQAVSAVAGLDR